MFPSVSKPIPPSSLFSKIVWGLKRALVRPVHVALIFVGVFFVLFSLMGHANPSDGIATPLSTHDISLQPGSELPVNVQVIIPPYPDQAIPVSFEVNHPPEITVDGELQPISAWFSLSRDLRIGARIGALPGVYPVTLRIHTRVGTQSFVHEETIMVEVGKRSRITFFTSPNTTIAPSLSNVVFSSQTVEMERNEKSAVVVSFVHHGSSTDYVIRFSETPIGIGAYVANASHHFVDDGQVVTSTIEITTKPATDLDTFPLYVEAYDVISGEKTQLGTVLVHVNPVINITASMPFHSYSVEKDRVVATYLTITNTEYGAQDVVIESSSNLLVPQVHLVNVPSKSSVSIPVQVRADSQVGVRAESVFVLNALVSASVPIAIETVPLASIPGGDDSAHNGPGPLIPSGFVSGVVSPLVGIIVVGIAVLLLVSKPFRDSIRARLPKQPAPPKAPAKIQKEELPAQKPIETGLSPSSQPDSEAPKK